MTSITIEFISDSNREELLQLQRDDVSEDIVDSVEHILATTQYGAEHGLKGRTYAIRYQGRIVGIILMGEGIPWSCDPPELQGVPFWRIMGFLIDRRYRSLGIGSQALEMVIRAVFADFGPRTIVLAVQENNLRAMRFYEKHGFVRNSAMDEDDVYFLRWFENA